MKKPVNKKVESYLLYSGSQAKVDGFFHGFSAAYLKRDDFYPTFILSTKDDPEIKFEYAHTRFMHKDDPTQSFDLWITYYNHNQKEGTPNPSWK